MSDTTAKYEEFIVPESDTAPIPPQRHRNSEYLDSTTLNGPTMNGRWLHPAMRDEPTGRDLLLGTHNESVYRESVQNLEASSADARSVHQRLQRVIAWADKEGKFNDGERYELATNIQFLINKEIGDNPPKDDVALILVREGNLWFRIDVRVSDRHIISGRVEMEEGRALCGLKRSTDAMVYGVESST